ncbi:trypsin-like peptidase domain-containing protein [Catenovulum sp. SM1970]|uniref:S1C family serine protease n=1 Tax=Marinifaba aquimaris TaxID=2741323 RepID=UPI00157235E5|nr:trypsin-like peptidase domain-containing protein [Marinifaba aquimaris]NTS75712.1 trypsin-like peptidase domain-containing protein [Marinifaba aquimaris]
MKLFQTLLVGLCLFASFISQARDFSSLYQQVDPSVVVIHTNSKNLRTTGEKLKTYTANSLGTGVVINNKGLILTAAHVVNAVDKLTITFADGSEYDGKVLVSISSADIALVEVLSNRDDFAHVSLGDSDKIKTGEEVFVIGTPYGLDHTLTVGHLSGRRTMESYTKSKLEFLQTDAAVNQGNSGGPMFNTQGELIGIVSHIQSKSGGSEGLGFAASINMVRERFLEAPAVWFGAEFTFLASELAAALNVPQDSGLLIEKVARNSFAEEIGLKGGTVDINILGHQKVIGGDIILAIGPHQIKAEKSLLTKVNNYLIDVETGDTVRMKVLRMGKVLELKVKAPKPSFNFDFE